MTTRVAAAVAALTTMVAIGAAGTGSATPGGLATTDQNHGGTSTTAVALAQQLIGGQQSGVTLTGATYTGSPRAAGTFTNGTAAVGFANGVVLGTGHIETLPGDATTTPCTKGVEGPNQCHEDANGPNPATSSQNGTPGDQQLTTLAGQATHDAAVLNITFVPKYPTIQFRYVFGSEEYNDWVNEQFNDVFGFFVNGQNCALVPGTNEPVSVNTINNGNPYNDPTPHNKEYYVDNVRPAPTRDTELDGLTTVLTCTATVTPNATNTLKLAIADASDDILDSAVFIEAGSLVSGTQMATVLHGNGQDSPQIDVPAGQPAYDSAKLSGANASAATGTVSYAVYSDSTCSTLVQSAGQKTVTGGVVPDSDPVVLTAPGTYYWQASYSGDLGNNAVRNDCGDEIETVTVPPRVVSVADGSGPEGGAVKLTVSLNQPAVVPVTVDFATSDGTATSPADYGATSGTVTIPAGSSSATIAVQTQDDTLDEADETFTVTLSNPTNATIGDGTARGTIVDNDPAPSISVSGGSGPEGDSGTSPATFTVTLSAASGLPVTVDYATHDGTATAGADYDATSGTLTFAPGQTTKTVTTTVHGDTAFEGNETFTLGLSNGASATWTILDDDNRPPVCSGASASPDTLWSPNGKFVTVTVSGCADPDGDPLTYTITKVQQDEARGSAPDAQRVAGHPNQVQLRADRLGSGNGRVYVITYTASDGHGAPVTGTVEVTVPHDQAHPAVDSGIRVDSGL